MSERLPSKVLVSALLRRANDAGGMGMMLARGDPQGGAILVIALEEGRHPRILERGIGPDGKVVLVAWSPRDSVQDMGQDMGQDIGSWQDMGDSADITHYWQRRRRNDPDLWVIELNTPFAERFTAETIL